MNQRIHEIRESEKQSHTEIYSSEELYKSDSWLKKPIKTVQELVPFFTDRDSFCGLDLGCGIGRNSIFLAEQFSKKARRIDCVDILDIAIEKLFINAKDHNVENCIYGVVDTIEGFAIPKNNYDLILAVSALEHVESAVLFHKKLAEIRDGVKANGIVCLVINSEVTEQNKATLEELTPMFEVNLKTEQLQAMITEVFSGWDVIKQSVLHQEYDIPRDNITSHLTTNVVTYVARKDAAVFNK